MSIEDNKAIGRRWGEEVWGKADVSVADQLAHPDITVAYPLLPETVHGIEAFKQVLAMVKGSLPDLHGSVDELIAEGDKVVIRWTMAGTQQGAFGSIPPTGKSVSWTGISICRIVDGKVIEDRGEEDGLGLMQQLGVVPTPEQVATPA
jgi:predicted ester cyclase